MPNTTPDAIERALQEAAVRILDGLTRVLRNTPGSTCTIKYEAIIERFRVVIETPVSRISCLGGSVQDAGAQAVSTLNADEIEKTAP